MAAALNADDLEAAEAAYDQLILTQGKAQADEVVALALEQKAAIDAFNQTPLGTALLDLDTQDPAKAAEVVEFLREEMAPDAQTNLAPLVIAIAVVLGNLVDAGMGAWDAYQITKALKEERYDDAQQLAAEAGTSYVVEATIGAIPFSYLVSKLGIKAARKLTGKIDEVGDAGSTPSNGADDVVYRGDTRGPNEIFEDGFQPRDAGSDTSLEDYVDYNKPSDYVGTTTNRPTGDTGSPPT